MNSKTFGSFFLFIICCFFSYSQEDSTQNNSQEYIINENTDFNCIIVAGGYNNGGVAEIGFGRVTVRPLKYLLGAEPKILPKNYSPGQINACVELLSRSNSFLFAPKVGLSMGVSMLNFSYANFLYYTDFTDGALSYRPEIGIALSNGKLNYGYNIPLSNKDFLKDYRHQIVFSWYFKAGKSKKITWYFDPSTQKRRSECIKE